MATKKPAQKAKKSAKAKARPVGRPSKFTQAIADKICEAIADGGSLRTICADSGMPDKATVLRWLSDDQHQAFCDQYARAREAQADKYAEEIIEIADNGENDTYVDENGNTRTDQDVIARSRLRVEARKWYASKLAPKKYGDKLAVGGADDLPPVQIQPVLNVTVGGD